MWVHSEIPRIALRWSAGPVCFNFQVFTLDAGVERTVARESDNGLRHCVSIISALFSPNA